MGKKVIKFTISDGDIDKAIHELELYKQEFQKKVDIYTERIADEVRKIASLNFGSATMEHTVRGGFRKPDVTVDVKPQGKILVVVATGRDAIWCEFGAGVYANGAAGSSPNPYGNDLGFKIGSYGEGKGKQQVWGFYTDPDNKTGLVLTHGTPASMPMYNAVQEVMQRAIEIAREVFG